jgi:hypothetical protein
MSPQAVDQCFRISIRRIWSLPRGRADARAHSGPARNIARLQCQFRPVKACLGERRGPPTTRDRGLWQGSPRENVSVPHLPGTCAGCLHGFVRFITRYNPIRVHRTPRTVRHSNECHRAPAAAQTLECARTETPAQAVRATQEHDLVSERALTSDSARRPCWPAPCGRCRPCA